MHLKTILMAHQKAAVAKTAPIRIGALFMDMGTGKSRTVIELAARRWHRIDAVFWFCPVSLKETVRREILKHTDAVPESIHVFDAKTGSGEIPPASWYVIGIESMSASIRVILAAAELITEKSFVIVDESSYIKGHRSLRTQHITNVSRNARYRMLLTGTPVSQGVVDLFAQMRFLSPKILGYNSFYAFAHNHLEYSDKFPGMIVQAHNTEHLAAKIAPYVYQVTKEECLDLPDKTYSTHWFRMRSDQAMMYEEVKTELLSELLDDWVDSYVIFRLFTALQQITCGFLNIRWHVDGEMQHYKFDHRRLQCLEDALDTIPANEKVIIWCKYMKDIKGIRTICPGAAEFHGKLNEKKRNAEIDKFRNGSRFLIATPATGGHGLTLNECRYVIFYNNGFKYADRIQAEDRNHRIGQKKNVHYIDLVCEDSIDERIMDALWAKGNVMAEFKEEVNKVKGDKRKALLEAL